MESLVNVSWLQTQFENPNLVILDATIPKVTSKNQKRASLMIKNARFFDIKNEFSDLESNLPNTLPNADYFTKKAQSIGINKGSLIVVYDCFGIYSAARAWWMFKIMGHHNVAVLNGGLPAWKAMNLPCQDFTKEYKGEKGDFIAKFNANMVANCEAVKQNIVSKEALVFDARSKERFYAEVQEPRKGMRSGHIPKSISLPYSLLINDGKLIENKKIATLFNDYIIDDKPLIFTCGSGVTAAILYLAASQIANNPKAIYDGSWSEWGQRLDCPIEKL